MNQRTNKENYRKRKAVSERDSKGRLQKKIKRKKDREVA
jgi:hypothetical protein